MTQGQAEIAIALLQQLVGETAALRAEVKALRVERARVAPAASRRGALSRADHESLGTLLPAISDALGDGPWSIADLLAHAEARDPTLQADLTRAIGAIPNRKSLGKALARCADREVGGLRLIREQKKRGVVVWRVRWV